LDSLDNYKMLSERMEGLAIYLPGGIWFLVWSRGANEHSCIFIFNFMVMHLFVHTYMYIHVHVYIHVCMYDSK
jgi:hypothetical protein